jgi:hypothetical protein
VSAAVLGVRVFSTRPRRKAAASSLNSRATRGNAGGWRSLFLDGRDDLCEPINSRL